MVYPALLPLMRTPRLPVVDWTDTPANLNGLVRFAERPNLVSARVPSRFKRALLNFLTGTCWLAECNNAFVCVSRYGTGGFTIQSVRSNDDYLILRDRTSSDGPHCLVATELEANSKSLVPSIVTVYFLLLVRYQHVRILGTKEFGC